MQTLEQIHRILLGSQYETYESGGVPPEGDYVDIEDINQGPDHWPDEIITIGPGEKLPRGKQGGKGIFIPIPSHLIEEIRMNVKKKNC
ncbi:MAG: hypothetical protein CMF50_09930 [Legionellales bacterium]|nr:hypothetical protein [Legionellales bacterium]